MTVAPAIEHVSIDGPAGSIEAIAQEPGMDGGRYAIVCHPHPLFGGTMENKVVTTLGRALLEAGIAVIRFNFRGVGRSSGVFDDGNGETADADAVAAWGAARWSGRQLVIAGFSFGAYVALRLVERRPAIALVTIAPPVGRFDFSRITGPKCPWLVVQGGSDEVVDPQSVVDWVDGMEPRPQLLIMPGVGHFFHGRLHELRDAVIDAVGRG
jgi:alpha/beta superfamily hydrolase